MEHRDTFRVALYLRADTSKKSRTVHGDDFSQRPEIQEECLRARRGSGSSLAERREKFFAKWGRVILLSQRAAVLEMQTAVSDSPWVFPATTKSGQAEKCTIRKRHRHTCAIAGIEAFPMYTFRHTTFPHWAKEMDPYTLAYLPGHSDFATTK